LAGIGVGVYFGVRSQHHAQQLQQSRKEEAQDAAAKSLVRNAMTAVESAFVDTRDFSAITERMLSEIEPSINWAVSGTTGVYTAATAECDGNEVDVALIDEYSYEVGTVSPSGKIFGVTVNKSVSANGTTGAAPGNTFYITDDGTTTEGW
jgi:hypothetical protein